MTTKSKRPAVVKKTNKRVTKTQAVKAKIKKIVKPIKSAKATKLNTKLNNSKAVKKTTNTRAKAPAANLKKITAAQSSKQVSKPLSASKATKNKVVSKKPTAKAQVNKSKQKSNKLSAQPKRQAPVKAKHATTKPSPKHKPAKTVSASAHKAKPKHKAVAKKIPPKKVSRPAQSSRPTLIKQSVARTTRKIPVATAKRAPKPAAGSIVKTPVAKPMVEKTKPAVSSQAAMPKKPSHPPVQKAKAVKKKLPQPNKLALHPADEIMPYHEEIDAEYMNKTQQEYFRELLLQRKQEFMEEMEKTVHHMQDEAANNFADPNDRATQEEEFGIVLRTRDRELKYIKNIEDALKSIDDGEYGYCEACGIEIGARRLEARPTATLCIDCKTLDEIREKQMGG